MGSGVYDFISVFLNASREVKHQFFSLNAYPHVSVLKMYIVLCIRFTVFMTVSLPKLHEKPNMHDFEHFRIKSVEKPSGQNLHILNDF